MSDEVLVKVEGVSKKFCRSLKRSLWYGVQDGRVGALIELGAGFAEIEEFIDTPVQNYSARMLIMPL